jgi:hypothetical protein
MLGDLRVAQLTADRTQRRKGTLLILAHQPRIAGDISRQYRCQSALDPLFAHLASRSEEIRKSEYDGTQPDASTVAHQTSPRTTAHRSVPRLSAEFRGGAPENVGTATATWAIGSMEWLAEQEKALNARL